jgi:hypothetical protein
VEENVKKELNTILMMINNWKNSYITWISEDGGNEYILQEFIEELNSTVSPYLRRLTTLCFLSTDKMYDFWSKVNIEIKELSDKIKEVENVENKEI